MRSPADDHVIVLSGDVPLIWWQTIEKLRDFHLAQKAAMTILTAEVADPQGYGRIVRRRAASAEVRAIVEEKKATAAERELREINSGIYVFAVKPLYRYIDHLIDRQSAQGVLPHRHGGAAGEGGRARGGDPGRRRARGAGQQHPRRVGGAGRALCAPGSAPT